MPMPHNKINDTKQILQSISTNSPVITSINLFHNIPSNLCNDTRSSMQLCCLQCFGSSLGTITSALHSEGGTRTNLSRMEECSGWSDEKGREEDLHVVLLFRTLCRFLGVICMPMKEFQKNDFLEWVVSDQESDQNSIRMCLWQNCPAAEADARVKSGDSKWWPIAGEHFLVNLFIQYFWLKLTEILKVARQMKISFRNYFL